MKAYQILSILLATAALTFAFQNCAKQGAITSSNSSSVDSIEMQKAMDTLESQIRGLSARDLSCVADADCKMAPVGAIHCGLPTFEVLTSSRSADQALVLSLAAQYKTIEKNYVATLQGAGASCGVLASPRPKCQANRCVIPAN